MAPENILEVRNIETYYGPIMAIRGVSLSIEQGQLVTVLGANGAGKTTLLRTLSGVMDPRVGTVTFDGRSIAGMEPDKVARIGLNMVPEGREVFPFLTVAENLAMGAFGRSDRANVPDDLDKVYDYFPRLRERTDQAAGLLSGGEQQMLAIGRALMARPRLLLLDEPSLGLSPILVKEIFEIIKRINQETGAAVLVVEQNARIALDCADFGYIMELGRIVMDGDCASLRDNPDIQEFYLGVKEGGIRGSRRWRRRKTWR